MRCLSARLPYRPHIYFAAFCFAQRLRWASPIFFMASAIILRFFGVTGGAVFLVPPPDSRARTCLSLAISESIEARISLSIMDKSILSSGGIIEYASWCQVVHSRWRFGRYRRIRLLRRTVDAANARCQWSMDFPSHGIRTIPAILHRAYAALPLSGVPQAVLSEASLCDRRGVCR